MGGGVLDPLAQALPSAAEPEASRKQRSLASNSHCMVPVTMAGWATGRGGARTSGELREESKGAERSGGARGGGGGLAINVRESIESDGAIFRQLEFLSGRHVAEQSRTISRAAIVAGTGERHGVKPSASVASPRPSWLLFT